MTASVCLEPGCPELAEYRGRCHTHKRNTSRSPSSRTTSTIEWRKLRDQVLVRDRGRCIHCGNKATQVHHRHPIAQGGDPLPHPSTLASVCDTCHQAAHGKGQGGDPARGSSSAVLGVAPTPRMRPMGFSGGRDGR